MSIGLHGNGFLVRLGDAERVALLKDKDAKIFEPMPGRPMREYIVASAKMLADVKIIAGWIQKSADYVRGLPPKVQKGRKPKK